MVRPSLRSADQLREIKFTRNYTKYAEGSVLVEFGDTKVLCTASITEGVPKFLKGTAKGWLTAEYNMLPRSCPERIQRELSRGGPSGRTHEIQRLIGRALRQALDLNLIGENTVHIDCDVLQADGGTRTASITGSCVALIDALSQMQKQQLIKTNPLKFLVAAISVGVYQGIPILDLDYAEDSKADTDMNVVMTEQGTFIEVQGTAESNPFQTKELQHMLELAAKGIEILVQKQRAVLNL